MAVGDYDGAFDMLMRAYEEPAPWLSYEGLVFLRPLRADPRFTELLKKVGLEPLSN